MTGRVVDVEESSLTVLFSDGTERVYSAEDVGANLSLSYINTIHKAQGSESPIVIFVYDGQSLHYPDKRLLYTALSRAKVRCVAVGPTAAFRQCLSKTVPPRHSHLAAFIGEKKTCVEEK
jgi:exodeoxyribonuclease V alpha subunit